MQESPFNISLYIRTNFVRTTRLKFVKKWLAQNQKTEITINYYISFKNLITNI